MADEDSATFPFFLVVELAAVSVELADDAWEADRAVIDVDEIDAPLVRLRIVEAECLRLDAEVLLGVADVEFLEVGVAVEDLLVIRDAVLLDPGIGADEAIGRTTNVGLPVRSGSRSREMHRAADLTVPRLRSVNSATKQVQRELS